jgi:hypothetical protein
VWPSQPPKLEPLLLAENKKKLLSSGLADSLLARVRGVLLYLQQKEHPDLVLADVPRITNYWMKGTGAPDGCGFLLLVAFLSGFATAKAVGGCSHRSPR